MSRMIEVVTNLVCDECDGQGIEKVPCAVCEEFGAIRVQGVVVDCSACGGAGHLNFACSTCEGEGEKTIRATYEVCDHPGPGGCHACEACDRWADDELHARREGEAA